MDAASSSAEPEFNPFTSDLAACPQAEYARLRSECPVARLPVVGLPIVSRHEDVMWALRHPEIFSSEMADQVALGTERPMIPQQIDPPRQTRFRKILDPQFSRKRMAELEPRVRAHATELIDAVIDRGECEFDSAFAIPLPCTAFLGLMGLPQDELGLFLELKDGIIRPPTGATDFEGGKEHRRKTGRRIYEYFDALIDERLARPRDDVMSYLVGAEIDGEKLSRNEILDICFLFLLGGLDTVTATLGCSVAYLAENPEQRRRLVEDPAKIPAAVEELLRWETPVMALPRLVIQDVTLAGKEIKKGELVTLLIGAANTDDAAFPDAQRVDFDREANRHIAFGAGPHRCLGSHLARMELRVALEEWHRRIPDYAIKPGERPTYTTGIREVRYLPLVW
jgi:cytochrome P450